MYFLYLVTGMANITIDEEQFFAEGGSELATTSQKSSMSWLYIVGNCTRALTFENFCRIGPYEHNRQPACSRAVFQECFPRHFQVIFTHIYTLTHTY